MSKEDPADRESDPRFPSGKWAGYFLMPITGNKRHGTELMLSFKAGHMSGEGRDFVGDFVVHGKYDVVNGKCDWLKHYIGLHDVMYQGYNEGDGIWGVWSIEPDAPGNRGGFHIWPEGHGHGDDQKLRAEADVPADPILTPV